MDSPQTDVSSVHGRARPTRVVAAGLILAGTIAALLVGVFLLRIQYSTGYAAFDTEKPDEVRAIISVMIASYDNTIGLVTAAFGAVAFLVAYQQKQRAVVTPMAWALLGAGLVFLTAGLILALFGREFIILMITRNAVELGIPMLNYGRWLSYSTIVLAAILISFFAIEVAVAEPPKEQTD
jgi:hypothetical protein